MKKLIFILLYLAPITASTQPTNIDSLLNLLHTQKFTANEAIEMYENITHYYWAAYDAEKTIEYGEKGLAISKKEKNDLKASEFNDYIGSGYMDKESYDTAYIYFKEALDLAIKTENIGIQVNAYMSIGAVYGYQEQWGLALESFFKALPISERLEDKSKYISILGNLGSSYI